MAAKTVAAQAAAVTETPLFVYSAFTLRVRNRADRLLLACKAVMAGDDESGKGQNADDARTNTSPPSLTRDVIVEVKSVPYRFYVPADRARHVDIARLTADTSGGRGGFAMRRRVKVTDTAKRSTADAAAGLVDVHGSGGGGGGDLLLETTCYNREAYLAAVARASESLRAAGYESPYTDCCFNFCHGSEALANCGIPGACVRATLVARDAEPTTTTGPSRPVCASSFRVEDASSLRCRSLTGEETRRLASSLEVAAMHVASSPPAASRSLSVADAATIRVARRRRSPGMDHPYSDARTERDDIEESAFSPRWRDADKDKDQDVAGREGWQPPDVLFVWDLARTVEALGGRHVVATLFTKRRECRASIADNGVFGLGVLVFDVSRQQQQHKWPSKRPPSPPGSATELLQLATRRRLVLRHLTNVVKSRTNSGVVHRDDGSYGPPPFDVFSSTMALAYQERGAVTAHDPVTHARPYEGGRIEAARAGFFAEPVLEHDFVGMYPTILTAFGMSKETYLLPPPRPSSPPPPPLPVTTHHQGIRRYFYDLGPYGGLAAAEPVQHDDDDDDDTDDGFDHRDNPSTQQPQITMPLLSSTIDAAVRRRTELLEAAEARRRLVHALQTRAQRRRQRRRQQQQQQQQQAGPLPPPAWAILDDDDDDDDDGSDRDEAARDEATACKAFANAAYGMLGNRVNPYSDTRVAGCVTAVGRRLVTACGDALSRRDGDGLEIGVPSSRSTAPSPSPLPFQLLGTYTDSLLIRCLDDKEEDEDEDKNKEEKKHEDEDVDDDSGFSSSSTSGQKTSCRFWGTASKAASTLAERFEAAILLEVRTMVRVIDTHDRDGQQRMHPGIFAERIAAATASRLRVRPKGASFVSLFTGKANKYMRLLATATTTTTISAATAFATRATLEKKDAGRTSKIDWGAREAFEDDVIVQVALKGRYVVNARGRFDAWDVERVADNAPVEVFLPSCGGWKRVVAVQERTTNANDEHDDEDDGHDHDGGGGDQGVRVYRLRYCDPDDENDTDDGGGGNVVERCYVRCTDDGLLVDAEPLVARNRHERDSAIRERCAATAEATRRWFEALARGDMPLGVYAEGRERRLLCVDGRRRDLEAAAVCGAAIDAAAIARSAFAKIVRPVECSVCKGRRFSAVNPLRLVVVETTTTTTTTTTTVQVQHRACCSPPVAANDDDDDDHEDGDAAERWLRSGWPSATFLNAVALSGCSDMAEVRERVDAFGALTEDVEAIVAQAKRAPPPPLSCRFRDSASPEKHEQALERLQRGVKVDPDVEGSVVSTFDRASTTCLPWADGRRRFYSLTKRRADRRLSTRLCELLHDATVACPEKRARFDEEALLAACRRYPAQRLSTRPPPVLKEGGRAPVIAWQDAIDRLALNAGAAPATPASDVAGPAAPPSAIASVVRWAKTVRARTVDAQRGRSPDGWCRYCGAEVYTDGRRSRHACPRASKMQAFACDDCRRRGRRCTDCGAPFEPLAADESCTVAYDSPTALLASFYQKTGHGDYYAYHGPKAWVHDTSFEHIVQLAWGSAHRSGGATSTTRLKE